MIYFNVCRQVGLLNAFHFLLKLFLYFQYYLSKSKIRILIISLFTVLYYLLLLSLQTSLSFLKTGRDLSLLRTYHRPFMQVLYTLDYYFISRFQSVFYNYIRPYLLAEHQLPL